MFLASGILLFGCSTDPQAPGVEYMPDMYRGPAVETYGSAPMFANNMEAQTPVSGTIPRGYLPYGIPNNIEGYELSGTALKNPFPMDEATVAEGKVIYSKYCQHCHGQNGAGDGPTVTAGHPPPPAYNSAALASLPEGKMFHSITYGKNLMGQHASQLNTDERWKVIRYVQTLQNPEAMKAATAPVAMDSNATVIAAEPQSANP
jgi:mono/diheme cytochrome c family protein